MDKGLDQFARAVWLAVGASAGLGVLIDEPDFLANDFKTGGDCPDFAESSEQNGTVPVRSRFEIVSKSSGNS